MMVDKISNLVGCALKELIKQKTVPVMACQWVFCSVIIKKFCFPLYPKVTLTPTECGPATRGVNGFLSLIALLSLYNSNLWCLGVIPSINIWFFRKYFKLELIPKTPSDISQLVNHTICLQLFACLKFCLNFLKLKRESIQFILRKVEPHTYFFCHTYYFVLTKKNWNLSSSCSIEMMLSFFVLTTYENKRG